MPRKKKEVIAASLAPTPVAGPTFWPGTTVARSQNNAFTNHGYHRNALVDHPTRAARPSRARNSTRSPNAFGVKGGTMPHLAKPFVRG